MTLADLIQLSNRMGAKLPSYEDAPSDADSVRVMNKALAHLGRVCEVYEPSVTWTMTAGVAEYRLSDLTRFSRLIMRPTQAILNGVRRVRGDQTDGLWTIAELESRYPDWRTNTAPEPFLVVFAGNDRVRVYGNPTTATVNAGGNLLSGYVVPGVISADGTYRPEGFSAARMTDVPDLPAYMHDVLAEIAAVMWVDASPEAVDPVQGRLGARASQAIEAFALENARALSPIENPVRPAFGAVRTR